jgi:hypothetical protein
LSAGGNIAQYRTAASYGIGQVVYIIERGNTTSAINQLNAFQNELSAQKGKKINQAAFDLLSAEAQYVIYSILNK